MDSLKPPDSRDPSEKLFLSWLDAIDRVTTFVCGRQHLSAADAEDFSAHVKLKLLENDCGILRKFQGRCAPRTFLSVVIQRLFQDFRISQWGKWRPSAKANRLGPTAVLLERLVTRDGHSLAEACEIIRTNHGVGATTADLEELFAQFPPRVKRRFQDDQVLVDVAASDRPPDELLLDHERSESLGRRRIAVRRAIAQLGDQDRLVLAYRFRDGHTVREIADILRLDYKSLFRRIDRLLRQLRTLLEQEGIEGLGGSDRSSDDNRVEDGRGSPEDRPSDPNPPMRVKGSKDPHDQRWTGTGAVAGESNDSATAEMATALTDWCDSEEETRWRVRL
jgi:RNA polymerase sigma factor (sigma-70 family)